MSVCKSKKVTEFLSINFYFVGEWMNGLRHGKGVYSWEVKGFNFQEGVSRDCFEGT